jgi:4-alpha-glucanotransferase
LPDITATVAAGLKRKNIPGGRRRTMNLALVIHNHQPIDNDTEIIERVYRTSYLPFLRKLSEFPTVKANIHYTGYLLEWIEKEHPDFIALLRRMVERGQVEMLGGGYYEPILVCIPDSDAKGQVELLGRKVQSIFGTGVRGLWTAERAWEPQAPEMLRGSGIDYTALDDTIFMSSGITEDRCFHPYLVESRGSTVVVFPMLKKLRYMIPWKSQRSTISFLRGHAASEGADIAVFGDDGEKFGTWPTTYEKVYTKGWLEGFFNLIVQNEEWLRTVTLSGYLDEHPAHERVYLPSASYDEMMEWSLPGARGATGDDETRKRMIGFWRLFLSKYPEGGRLYAKMISVSDMVRQVVDGNARAESLREVWKGQCNDAYWHGVFGGLYSTTLRRITYHHLVLAQRMVESESKRGRRGAEGADGGKDDYWLETGEETLNGYREHAIDTRSLGLRLCPDVGGALAEFDFKDAAINLFDTLPRREESYHAEIRKASAGGHSSGKAKSIHDPASSKEAGLHELLAYDRYPKFSFLDYIVEKDTVPGQFLDQTFEEIADFAGRPYEIGIDRTAEGASVGLSRTSRPRSGTGDLIRIRKRLDIPMHGSSILFAYRVDPGSGGKKTNGDIGRLAVEINLGSLGDASFIKSHTRPGMVSSTTKQEIEYPELGLKAAFEFSRPMDVWLVPVRTVSRSESGYESNLQGISVIPNLPLAAGVPLDLAIRLSVAK